MKDIKSLRLKYRKKSNGDDLFAQLRENPTDYDTLMILGDWLEEQGDPLDEVVRALLKWTSYGRNITIEQSANLWLTGLRGAVHDVERSVVSFENRSDGVGDQNWRNAEELRQSVKRIEKVILLVEQFMQRLRGEM